MTKRFWVFAACAALLGVFGCEKPIKRTPPPTDVLTVKAFQGYARPSSWIIGQTRGYDEVDLVARVKGFLTKRNFVEGHLVKKDQVLFEIERTEYFADVKNADAALRKAEAELARAEIEVTRQKNLLDLDATAERTYEDAAVQQMTAKANVLAAQAQLDLAKLNLSYTEVKSPFDGRVSLATYSVGNVVGPESKKLASVQRFDPLRVAFNVREVDVLRLNLQRVKDEKSPISDLIVKLRMENGNIYRHTGELRFSSNQVDPGTGTFLVEAVFPNSEQILLPGMYVKVIIESKNKMPAVFIPQICVQEDQAGKYVLAVNERNEVERKGVKLGMLKDTFVQAESGLGPGTLVITEGTQKVRSGAKVNAKPDPAIVPPDDLLDSASGVDTGRASDSERR